MSSDLIFRYSDPGGLEAQAAFVSVASNIRFGEVGLALSAEVGDPAMSTIEIDDPGGIYTFAGLRAFYVRENAAASNNQVIGAFTIQDREVRRDAGKSALVAADRIWSMDLTDYNWHLGKRIIPDADAKRPIETAGDRIRWLLHRADTINLNDYGHVTYPSHQMDATDYRGQHAGDVLADCVVEGGYNFWCDFNEAHWKPELFLMDPDSADYYSSLTISNVLTDNADNCFAPSEDAILRRSPSRIAYGVYLAYANGDVYVRRDATGTAFGYLDQTAPMSNVKTAARATRVANKFLSDNATETDRIICSIVVPAAQVNDIRQGHLMSVKFSHFPGYESFTPVRVLRRTVSQDPAIGQEFYRIGLELTPTGSAFPPASDFSGNMFAGLQRSQGNAASSRGPLIFIAPYDTGVSGWDTQAATGPVAIDAPTLNLNAGTMTAYNGFTVSDNVTVRIYCHVFWAQGITEVLNVRVNGAIVSTVSKTSGGGSGSLTIDLRNYHLNSGDHVTVDSLGSVGGGGGDDVFWSNSGTNGTQFIVGRGSYTNVHLAASGTVTFTGP